MTKAKRKLSLCIMVLAIFSMSGAIFASTRQNVREILSIKTGKGLGNIGNQFFWVNLEPFNGFVIDSKGDIIISDGVNHRIMRFSKEGKLIARLTLGEKPPFYPDSLCLDGDENLYVHNLESQEIVAFSPDGKVLSTYSPASVLEHKDKRIKIISHKCGKSMIKLTFGFYGPKTLEPVYVDEYDQHFKLLKREIYNDAASYYESLLESSSKSGFEKHFEDSNGNQYGYEIVYDWYGKFLPLRKYSSSGSPLDTFSGLFLTKLTRYKVYDYYTIRATEIDWTELKGNNLLIVNWYVSPNGIIYALLANRDYVKVLRITQ